MERQSVCYCVDFFIILFLNEQVKPVSNVLSPSCYCLVCPASVQEKEAGKHV